MSSMARRWHADGTGMSEMDASIESDGGHEQGHVARDDGRHVAQHELSDPTTKAAEYELFCGDFPVCPSRLC